MPPPGHPLLFGGLQLGFIFIEFAVKPAALLIWLVLCLVYFPLAACCGEEEFMQNGERVVWIFTAFFTCPISDGKHGWGDGVAAIQVLLLWGQGEEVPLDLWCGGIFVGNPYDILFLVLLILAALGAAENDRSSGSNRNDNRRALIANMSNQSIVQGNNNQVTQTNIFINNPTGRHW